MSVKGGAAPEATPAKCREAEVFVQDSGSVAQICVKDKATGMVNIVAQLGTDGVLLVAGINPAFEGCGIQTVKKGPYTYVRVKDSTNSDLIK